MTTSTDLNAGLLAQKPRDEPATTETQYFVTAAHDGRMVSGYGLQHKYDPDKGIGRPYDAISLDEIRALVDDPQRCSKADSRWVIPSSLLTRNFQAQREHGSYWMLWFDLDQMKSRSLEDVLAVKTAIFGDVNFELYTTHSAAEDDLRCRLLVPLSCSIGGDDFELAQNILNHKFAELGITPDPATQRAGQACLLPNRSLFYDKRSERSRALLDPSAIILEVQEARLRMLAEEAVLAAKRAAVRESRKIASAYDRESPIDFFNRTHTVDEILIRNGYAQRGNTFRHPKSESGSFSASVKDGRVHSLSTNDPLYSGGSGGGAHDAFSAFMVLEHAGNQEQAIVGALKLMPPRLTQAGQISAYLESQPNAVPVVGRTRLKARTAAEILKDKTKRQWLVKGLLERNTFTFVFGVPACGKSFLVIDLAACVAAGVPWHCLDVSQGPVFYVAGEGHGGLQRRIKGWAKHNEIDLADVPLIITGCGANLGSDMGVQEYAEDIAALAEEFGAPALIVIDTFAANATGGTFDESNNGEVNRLMARLKTVSSVYGSATVAVHHSGHPKGNGEDDRLRGAISLMGAADNVIRVSKSEANLELSTRKLKEGESWTRNLALQKLDLGTDDEGEPLDTAIVVGDASVPGHVAVKAPKLKKPGRLCKDALIAAALAAGVDAPDGKIDVPLEAFDRALDAAQPADVNPSTVRSNKSRGLEELIERKWVVVVGMTATIPANDGAIQAKSLLASNDQVGPSGATGTFN